MNLSISKKATIMIVVFALVLIAAATGMYARVIVNLTNRQYGERAENLAATAAAFVDGEEVAALRNSVMEIYNSVENKVFSDEWGSDEWNAYIANFESIEQTEAFISVRETLRKVQDASGADCHYVAWIDPATEAFIYLVDAAYEGACPPGCIDEVYEENRALFDDPERGFPAYTTDTEEYGRLITAGVPIHYNGEVIAYSMCDYSIQALRDEQAISIWKLYGYLVATALVICVIAVLVAKRTIVKQIKALTDASRRFAQTRPGEQSDAFANVNVTTRDELRELAEAMKNMEVQINSNVRELVDINEQLVASQQMASEMSELANKDPLTGVGNKMAYEHYVAKLDESIVNGRVQEFGVAMVDLNSLKGLNDTYGHNFGDAAIVKLSKMICDTFSHSPVFRIGGDEFTVIMQTVDFRRAETLVSQFRNKMKEIAGSDDLPPEEKITAAIGFARFEHGADNRYDDVFDRADNDMYRVKSEMKQ